MKRFRKAVESDGSQASKDEKMIESDGSQASKDEKMIEMSLFYQGVIGFFVWAKIMFWILKQEDGLCNFVREYFNTSMSSADEYNVDMTFVSIPLREFANGYLMMDGTTVGHYVCSKGTLMVHRRTWLDFLKNFGMGFDVTLGSISLVVLSASMASTYKE